LLINDDGLVSNEASLRVALVTGHVGMPSLQREMSSCVVIERGGHPALRVVTIHTRGFASFGKLSVVRVLVAILAYLRRALKLHFLCAYRHRVTRATFHSAMRAEQRKLRFGMVETIDVGPGTRVVAGLAAERSAVGAALRHAVIEFALMRILVAAGASQVIPVERQDLVGAARSAHFVTFVATDGSMRANKRITGLAVHRHGVGGDVEVANSVAVLAAVLVWRCGELAVVLVFVAVQTSSEFDFVNCVLGSGKMALGALDFDVFTLQRVTGSIVLLDAKE